MKNPFNGEEVAEVSVVSASAVSLEGLKKPEMVMVCTMPTTTPEEKKRLYNMVQAPNNNLKECVNMPIDVVDIYAEVATLSTGDKAPRIILIDKDGVSYGCVSFGILHSLEKIFALFGEPHYEVPLTVVAKLRNTKKGQTLALEIV